MSTILLGFGTVVSIPNVYNDYKTTDYTISNNSIYNECSDLIDSSTFDAVNNDIYQISVLNTDINMISVLNTFIHSIVDNSKSLDSDISQYVSEHFWELV